MLYLFADKWQHTTVMCTWIRQNICSDHALWQGQVVDVQAILVNVTWSVHNSAVFRPLVHLCGTINSTSASEAP